MSERTASWQTLRSKRIWAIGEPKRQPETPAGKRLGSFAAAWRRATAGGARQSTRPSRDEIGHLVPFRQLLGRAIHQTETPSQRSVISGHSTAGGDGAAIVAL
jgi:hypothetical protein